MNFTTFSFLWKDFKVDSESIPIIIQTSIYFFLAELSIYKYIDRQKKRRRRKAGRKGRRRYVGEQRS